MPTDTVATAAGGPGTTVRTPEPALSWAAIFAGAVTALAVSILLTAAAAGLGFKLAVSGLPSHSSLADFTPEAGAYTIIVQVLSGALGGYLAGRLRTIWVYAHDDEAHFRDTAHGLIAWAVATVAGVILAATVLTPYAEQLASASVPLPGALTPVDQAQRAANIAMQSFLFVAIGMLLSAFVAAVAARLGGMQAEEMHAKGRAI